MNLTFGLNQTTKTMDRSCFSRKRKFILLYRLDFVCTEDDLPKLRDHDNETNSEGVYHKKYEQKNGFFATE